MFWDVEKHCWNKLENVEQFYWRGDGRRKLLVPKCFVKPDTYNTARFNRFEVLPDLIQKELEKENSSIITTLNDGMQRITKKDMIEKLSGKGIVLDKFFVREYAKDNPECIESFRRKLAEQHKKIIG